ncbi:MAG TPA: ABC transporter ATP-binding protein [Pyrinomonadaceae bacterium]|nr:ABC transporter ATP-binding protein [Pyrinomonadaceae bacterium]
MSIQLINLNKSFGAASVVDDLSLEFNDGEFVVLLGPSGCGKTTTLRMIAGLEQATSGDIFIDGQRVNQIPPQRRDLAMVFQSYALYPHMSVAENIGYPLRIRKLDRGLMREKIRETAALLEIEPLLSRKPRELSGGERQRVALARAIVRAPRAFLMDEPLSNLDAKLRVQMRAELKRLQRKLKTTTVYVTHDQAEAMTLGHRVAVMHKGRLQQFDTPLEIYHHPANRFVAEFVGTPGMNFLTGKAAQNLFPAGTQKNADAVVGVRPEHIQVSSTPRDGWHPARVYVTELMGNEVFVFLEIHDEQVIARAPGDFRAEPETTVWINPDQDRLHFFDAGTGMRI